MIPNQIWHQDIDGVIGDSEIDEGFGSSLAIGDFNGDGRDDLAIGVPSGNIDNIENVGAVNVLYGSNSGLTATDDQLWHQDINGVMGDAETGDLFGFSLAAGDFNGDGRDDLAIGVLSENIDNIGITGAVNVIYGDNNGLTATDDQIWLDIDGVRGDSANSDSFSSRLAVGDFNGDGRDDLAISAFSQSIVITINFHMLL